jgi:F-type H+-transporting ATPase subunit a
MDFGINVWAEINITDSLRILITDTQISMFVVAALLVALAVVVRVKSRSWNSTGRPKGLQNAVEFAVESFYNLYKGNAGERVLWLAPWFFALFAFLILANIIGIVGLRPPTADWGMTLALALTSFALIQFAGLRYRPKAYLRGIFLEPFFLFAPLNVLGELARPISLSFRLFGNVLGGMILISLVYNIAPWLGFVGLPLILHGYFDIIAGLLQAFIFTMLSIAFVGLNAND